MIFDELMLQPIYEEFGVTGHLVTEAGDEYDLTVIDKSAGIDVALGDMGVPTVRPAAAVRRVELEDNNVDLVDIDDGQLTVNNKRWRVRGWVPRPNPDGEGQGEVYLLLVDEKLDRE